ncbi:MAG: helix-turn-helix domain-containing protein [Lachnospiraceae bacterium]|nr:helix-turn-helix domain-containing protein [Lachnospiraceae bacterium]
MADLQISLAAARVNAGMTQDDVAKELHVTKQTLVDWEKGKSEPRISQARELSRILAMPLDHIIFLSNKSN